MIIVLPADEMFYIYTKTTRLGAMREMLAITNVATMHTE